MENKLTEYETRRNERLNKLQWSQIMKDLQFLRNDIVSLRNEIAALNRLLGKSNKI
jgi:hypothetical protein